MGMVTYPWFMNYYYITSCFFYCNFEWLGIFSHWYYFICISHHMKHWKSQLGNFICMIKWTIFKFFCLRFG